MKHPLPPLGSLRAFEAVARSLSFSHAAVELGVTQGAISRQIKILEDHLNIRLFRRFPRYIELTEQGRVYFRSIHQAFDELYRGTEAITGNHRTATLNVNVLPTFAIKWFIPRLPHFTAANPSIEVRMITSIKPVDFRLEDNDVAIRVGANKSPPGPLRSPIDLQMTSDWVDVRAIPLVPDELTIVCSPTLLKNGPPLREPSDLHRFRLLHTASRPKAWAFWFHSAGHNEVPLNQEGAYGHFFMTLQAAVEGKGVAIVPKILANQDLEAGILVSPFPSANVIAGTYYLLFRESHLDIPKVKRFRAWIFDEISTGESGQVSPVQEGELR